MKQLKDLIDGMKFRSKQDIELVTKAFFFSEKLHKNQTRFSGEPYFNHVYETALILSDLGMSSTTISAGLLHDSLEDGNVSEQELEKNFNKEILFLVQGVTKLGKIKYRGSERHNESLRKLFVAVSQDIRVVIIKLADRLHNMKTLDHVPDYKQLRIAKETLEIYAPISYRLGIRKISRQLEDLSFKYVYPKEYQKTKEIVKARFSEELNKLKKFEKSVKKILARKNFINFTVSYRVKTLYSSYKKLERKDWNIEKIYDISALRIIVPSIEDCYRVLGIIHGTWRPLPGRIKDYIAFPKPNGYRSLHTTIFTGYGNVIEIQIKTDEMYKESEYGIASHLNYKQSSFKKKNEYLSWIKKLLPFKRSPDSLKKTEEINFDDIPSWIKDLVEFQSTNKSITDSDEEEIKNDFFQQRIFVFTPLGDVIDLPIGSTPIDFAYAVHSDIGDRTAGAKVNSKMTSLEDPLKNGDIVEIITKKEPTVNRKWLDFAKTATAKKNIKTKIIKK